MWFFLANRQCKMHNKNIRSVLGSVCTAYSQRFRVIFICRQRNLSEGPIFCVFDTTYKTIIESRTRSFYNVDLFWLFPSLSLFLSFTFIKIFFSYWSINCWLCNKQVGHMNSCCFQKNIMKTGQHLDTQRKKVCAWNGTYVKLTDKQLYSY